MENFIIPGVFFNVLNDFPKTSNTLEGWHRIFKELVSNKHPILFEILEKPQTNKTQQKLNLFKVFLK